MSVVIRGSPRKFMIMVSVRQGNRRTRPAAVVMHMSIIIRSSAFIIMDMLILRTFWRRRSPPHSVTVPLTDTRVCIIIVKMAWSIDNSYKAQRVAMLFIQHKTLLSTSLSLNTMYFYVYTHSAEWVPAQNTHMKFAHFLNPLFTLSL